MDEKVLNMTGYEFENYISTLLTKMGFEVEVTQYSNDGGIDLIATYEKPIFSGKYIVQCKKWGTSVGQPEVRDLYGVVMDQRANKGILITTSDFTAQAYEFAKGKNIELINGEVLNTLTENNICDINIQNETTDFEYRNARYNYLKKKINEEPNEAQNYVDLIQFLRGCIKDKKDSVLLITEYIDVVEKMISRCFKKASKAQDKEMAMLLQAEAYIYLGDLAKATEILVRVNRFFIQVYPANCHLSTKKYQGFGYAHLYAWNLYAAYKYIGYQNGCDLILSKFNADIHYTISEYIESRFAEDICGKKFIHPIVQMAARGGKTKHLETMVFYLQDVLDANYFFNKYYHESNELIAKEIDEVLSLNGII